MKPVKLVSMVAMVLVLTGAVSCQHQDDESNKPVYATVTLEVADLNNSMGPDFVLSSGVLSSIISAVPAEMSTVTAQTDLSSAYDRQMLVLDSNTVVLLLPLNTRLRIVKFAYQTEYTRAEILANSPIPDFYGISAEFVITAETTSITCELTMSATAAQGTVAVSNVADGGVVQSGFLIGTLTGSDTFASVEVSIDSGSWEVADGTTSWKLQLPTGTNTWKEGSLHSIMVRAKNTSGIYTATITLSMRKGPNRDVDGDGYGDAIVGAPYFDYSSDEGRAYLYLGSSTGISSSADAEFTGDAASARMGNAFAIADINGDGFGDLLIGESNCGGGTGHVYVFLGGAGNKALSDQNLSAAGAFDTQITGEGATYFFGNSVAAGDINGDGYADLVVGAISYGGSNEGRVYIFYGSASGISISAAGSADNIISQTTANAELGTSLAVGDVNGDGFADLAAGAAYYAGTGTGRVYLVLSSASGIPNIADIDSSANQIFNGEGANNYFGYSVALGDVNGDGNWDLAVGARMYNATSHGRVYLYHGSASGLSATADTTYTGTAAAEYLGQSLSFGNPNRDAYADLLIGARRPGGYGFAQVYNGGATGLAASPSATLTGFQSGGEFGYAVSLVDVNGDGRSDIFVGAIAYSASQGRAYMFYTPASGPADVDMSSSGTADVALDGVAASDQLGTAVH